VLPLREFESFGIVTFPTSNRFDEVCEISRLLVANRPGESLLGATAFFQDQLVCGLKLIKNNIHVNRKFSEH
jgi:hypothetical protein